jgi:hypothetical protein
MKKSFHFLLLSMIIIGFISSCKKEEIFYTGTDVALKFTFGRNLPADTLYFDTVFTQKPGTPYPRSVNKQFFIVNNRKQSVKTNIQLAGSDQSPFRMNIDGVPGRNFRDVIIPAGDSIVGFVEVSLQANNQLNPAIVMDSILFTTNTQQQRVILSAYGWDAIYLKDSTVNNNLILDVTDKPYVLINYLFVPENASLQLKPGISIYSAPGTFLFVQGSLEIEGTSSQPVRMQGDRLQPGFEEIPGQWGGIHLLKDSKNNVIKNAIIKNAQVGVRVDSLSNNINPKLKISETLIQNCAAIGILGITTSIEATNVAIARCGSNGFVGYFGGNYMLKHCTIASGFLGGRSQAALAFNNIERDNNDRFVKSYPLGFSIQNSIVFGPLDDEFILDIDNNGNPANPSLIEYSLIKTDLFKTILNNNNNIINSNPQLENPRESKLNPLGTSVVKGKGRPLSPAVPTDIEGKNHNNPPDMGAYALP